MEQESTNTFDGGLISDLNPLTTPKNILTDALNATLLTFNGNELVLQNDLGNTQIAGAKLSDGFVPVGMKENGGILYILSTNPSTNETEIGSFPSPEEAAVNPLVITKNIDIDSTGSILNTNIQLTDKKLTAGDSFIIFFKSDLISNLITSYSNRKYYKFKLISIENGIETDITSTLSNQYKLISGNWEKQDYWFVPLSSIEDFPEIDDYTNNNYVQRYKARKGGKLYLKIELEDIDSFLIDNSIESSNTTFPILKVENENGNIDRNYYLEFNLKATALSKIKPDTININLQIIDLSGKNEDKSINSGDISIVFEETDTEKNKNNIYLQIGESNQYVVVYTITIKNNNYGISFDNHIITEIIDLSIDPSQWANSKFADYNFYDYDLFDYETL